MATIIAQLGFQLDYEEPRILCLCSSDQYTKEELITKVESITIKNDYEYEDEAFFAYLRDNDYKGSDISYEEFYERNFEEFFAYGIYAYYNKFKVILSLNGINVSIITADVWVNC